jgi:hypothetical protein
VSFEILEFFGQVVSEDGGFVMIGSRLSSGGGVTMSLDRLEALGLGHSVFFDGYAFCVSAFRL